MHGILVDIKNKLEQLAAHVQATVPNDEPFGNAHNNWSFPGLSRFELIEEAQSLIDLLNEQGGDELGDHEGRLSDYLRRLDHLRNQTVGQIWSSSAQAVPAYIFTLQGLRKALAPVLVNDGQAAAAAKLKQIATQLRGMESRLNGLEPRTETIETMVGRIEQAYNAADQLPTDLEALAEARREVGGLVAAATKDKASVATIHEQATKIDHQLTKNAADAKAVLEQCETAYSAATSVGLAKAFSERSDALSNSMWLWVAGLVAALVIGGIFGTTQLSSLSELLRTPGVPSSTISLNLLLSIVSVGGPVWFAWLATKQIGQRFRLAEDYAFKASISRAYEGFRREAARFDKDMEAKLLSSALSRFDEQPLRLVEPDTHGSPWHELASSDVVKQAMKIVPGFASQVQDIANKAIASIKPVNSSVMPKNAVQKDGE